MLHMLKRFIELKKPVELTLVEFDKKDMFPSDSEIKVIEDLIEPLDIIEACSRRLCSRDVNLAKADQIFEYELQALGKLETDIGKRFAEEIKYRITERRLTSVATLLAYLENPMFLSLNKNLLLQYANKTEIQKLARDILMRLFPSANEKVCYYLLDKASANLNLPKIF